MGVVKKLKKRRQEKMAANVIRQGLILLGFNLALILALFFALIGTTTFTDLMQLNGLMLLFVPLVIIFLFAGVCGILWYRFGQIMRGQFKQNKILLSSTVALISIIPLLLLLVFLSSLLSVWGSAPNFFVNAFIGTVFITILAVIFEMPVVIGGIMTKE